MSNHKYAELANKLREAIKTGVYVEGEKLPSENQLALQTGYSRQTVRQAISVLESEGLTSRIQGSGTYVRGVRLHREPTHNIAVVTTYIGEYIFPAILKGIDQVLAENGYTSMLSATRNRVDNERKVLMDLLNKPIDGLIVEGTKTALPNPNIDLYEQFSRLGIPVVFINGYYPELKNIIYVVADDRSGGKMACDILLKKGHKRIAGIFKSDDIQGHRRYAGYAEALFKAELSVDDDNVMWYTTENRDSIIASTILQVLSGCTAVVCYNDEVAYQVLKELQQQKSNDTLDVEIVSFDNSIIAKFSAAPYISLSNPKEKIGYLAASKMINILKNEKEKSVVLPWSIE
jgi:GntR family transcriptional regulator of arabinose operon